MCGLRDVARAQEQNQITRQHSSTHGARQFLERGNPLHRLALCLNGFGEPSAVDPGDFGFTGGIDFSDPEPICAGETSGKLVQQVARAGKAVRLKSHQQPAAALLSQRLDRGPNFSGVMPVVIHQAEAAVPKQFLLAAGHPLKGGDGGGDFRRAKPKLMQERNHRARVGQVLVAQ